MKLSKEKERLLENWLFPNTSYSNKNRNTKLYRANTIIQSLKELNSTGKYNFMRLIIKIMTLKLSEDRYKINIFKYWRNTKS